MRIVSFGGDSEMVQRMRSDVRLIESVKVYVFAPSATNARQYVRVDVIPEQRGIANSNTEPSEVCPVVHFAETLRFEGHHCIDQT